MPSINTISSLGPNTFIENLAIRNDNSILITSMNTNTLHLVPATSSGISTPVHLYTFSHSATGIVEISPDVFIISVSHHGSLGTAALYKLDMRAFDPNSPSSYTVVHCLDLPEALWLNGSTTLPTPNCTTILLADSYKGSIFRVSIPPSGPATSSVWISHPLLAKTTTIAENPAWPGVNGIKYHNGYVYATSSEARLFLRIRADVDDGTFDAAEEPEVLSSKQAADDFIVDAKKNVAYVTTNPSNTLLKIGLDGNGEREYEIVAGGPKDKIFAGPTACAWGRGDGEEGRVLYVSTNGGMVAPVDGIVEPARVLKLELY